MVDRSFKLSAYRFDCPLILLTVGDVVREVMVETGGLPR